MTVPMIIPIVAGAATLVMMGGAGFCVFMLFRNKWVYRTRMGILRAAGKTARQQLDDYERLPSYDVMLGRFWVWDVSKFMAPKPVDKSLH